MTAIPSLVVRFHSTLITMVVCSMTARHRAFSTLSAGGHHDHDLGASTLDSRWYSRHSCPGASWGRQQSMTWDIIVDDTAWSYLCDLQHRDGPVCVV